LLQGKKGAAQAAPFFYADQEENLDRRNWLWLESWSREISREIIGRSSEPQNQSCKIIRCSSRQFCRLKTVTAPDRSFI
jgi:hypothetical protein